MTFTLKTPRGNYMQTSGDCPTRSPHVAGAEHFATWEQADTMRRGLFTAFGFETEIVIGHRLNVGDEVIVIDTRYGMKRHAKTEIRQTWHSGNFTIEQGTGYFDADGVCQNDSRRALPFCQTLLDHLLTPATAAT